MENTYLTALHGMEKLLSEAEYLNSNFRKKSYMETFRTFYEKNVSVFQALEEGYNSAIDKEQYITNMANGLVSVAASMVDEKKKKSHKNSMLMDLNLVMVVYIFPAILNFKGNSVTPLVEALQSAWKKQFPETNISAANVETIESGFHKKWCYITTAICETFGKPDDCYELNILRSYRDSYLMSQEDGELIIKEYYDVAPTIVKRINKRSNKKEIYQNLWDEYLNPCIRLIENNQKQECRDLYIKMVRELEEEYFYKN